MTENRPTIAQEIEELRGLPVRELVLRYETLYGRPPRSKHRTWLWRRCAWKLQERRYGGLSRAAKKRLDELIAEIDLPLGERPEKRPKTHGDPPVGTALTREWHGTEITARKTENGWEHDGVEYRSLTALAKAATGAHRSGPRFFGLTKGTS